VLKFNVIAFLSMCPTISPEGEAGGPAGPAPPPPRGCPRSGHPRGAFAGLLPATWGSKPHAPPFPARPSLLARSQARAGGAGGRGHVGHIRVCDAGLWRLLGPQWVPASRASPRGPLGGSYDRPRPPWCPAPRRGAGRRGGDGGGGAKRPRPPRRRLAAPAKGGGRHVAPKAGMGEAAQRAASQGPRLKGPMAPTGCPWPPLGAKGGGDMSPPPSKRGAGERAGRPDLKK
jgi:hypothetical protein